MNPTLVTYNLNKRESVLTFPLERGIKTDLPGYSKLFFHRHFHLLSLATNKYNL